MHTFIWRLRRAVDLYVEISHVLFMGDGFYAWYSVMAQVSSCAVCSTGIEGTCGSDIKRSVSFTIRFGMVDAIIAWSTLDSPLFSTTLFTVVFARVGNASMSLSLAAILQSVREGGATGPSYAWILLLGRVPESSVHLSNQRV